MISWRRRQKNKQSYQEALFNLPVVPPVSGPDTLIENTNEFSRKLFTDYLQWDIGKSVDAIQTKNSEYWQKAGEQMALSLFREAAERVPAYKKFLKENNVNARKVKSIENFKKVPWINKDNYLRKYSLSELSWDGALEANHIISTSSGSSGVPFYWPRSSLLEMETTYLQEMYLNDIFEVKSYKTLYIDAFAMGLYIAGPVILNTALRVAQKGYPLTIITPGLEISDTLQAIQDIAGNYEQIVLAGYPPFLKDIIDEGINHNIDWSKYRMKFLLAGEGFNESWREYVAERVGEKNMVNSFINIYGTADASIVGHETPTSVAIRRLAASDNSIFKKLFPAEKCGRLPTLVQYCPTLKYFEEIDSELLFTASAGIPLIRYNIHDFGGVKTFSEIVEAVGMDVNQFDQHLKQYDKKLTPWQLPFVYLYGKSDFTVTLYGLNIYPENIKMALEDCEVRDKITGRFAMSTEYHPKTNNQYLLINVEIKRDTPPNVELERGIINVIIKTLRQVNAEYNKLYSSIGVGRSEPVVKLCKYGDPKHFKRGIKHTWTKR
jgi:phenylacetate-CoA ligase